jgi:hypothetical protein
VMRRLPTSRRAGPARWPLWCNRAATYWAARRLLLPEDSVAAADLGRQTVSSGRSLSQSRAAPTDLTITPRDKAL